MRTSSRRFAVLPVAAAVLAGLAGCSGGLRVPAPATSGTASAQCRALQARLPQTLLGRKRRSSTPASADTAAWGDPAITLRCGVAEPGPLNPASADYDPKSLSTVTIAVDGVCWLTQSTSGGGFRFTTVKQQTYVEVNVPGAYQGQSYPLPALAAPVQQADPVNPDRTFDCL